MTKNALLRDARMKWFLIFAAWFSILFVSDLNDVVFRAVSGHIPEILPLIKLGFLGLFLAACLVWKIIRPLLSYAMILFVLFAALKVSDLIKGSAWWAGVIDGHASSFTLGYLKVFILDTGVMLAVLTALAIIKRRGGEFFLVKGQLDASIEPVPWLGIRKGESWRTFGWIFAAGAALGVAVPFVLGMRPSLEVMSRTLPLFPAVLCFAAINAFNEELYFRASLLSTLPQAVGKTHALLITVVFFGMAHVLYGSPPGIIGFSMTGFLAFLMGKAMLETKGFVWPWFIHFLPDVIIFWSYTIAWVKG